jgi:Uroporphyrinogen decarboxylase (URO-D)
MTSPAMIDRYQEENENLKKQIEKKTGKSTEKLYAEREKRVREAVGLKVPDRVPYSVSIDAQSYTGVPNSATYYDPIAYKTAVRKITVDLEPDMCIPGLPSSGAAMEALDVQNRLWPGGPEPAHYEYQFIEGEYMKEDEYDLLLSDPTDFMLRCYLPRVYGALAPLSRLPSFSNMFVGFEGVTAFFATPEFEQLARALRKAGQEMEKFRAESGNAQEELALLGFPAFSNMGSVSVGGAPFDTISSSLRGMKGSMLDMYRQPEKLIRACEVILDRRIARSQPADPKKRGNPKRIGMPLWRGDKTFMSEAQFKRFYWPGLKKAMQALIDLGYSPMPFFEAEFGDRLEYLLELPKGKIVATVEHMDVVRAKQILGGHTCILGKGPSSLRLSSLKDIETYYKGLIDKCGKGGGFMISMGLPKGKKEDVQAMLKSLKEYGRY